MWNNLNLFLGEFEFNGLYESHQDDMASLVYATILLVTLAIMGSLVLVNLILALILSDVTQLYSQSHSKEVFRKARQARNWRIDKFTSRISYILGGLLWKIG